MSAAMAEFGAQPELTQCRSQPEGDPQFVDDPHGGQTQPNPKEKQCKTSSNHRQAQVAWACKMVQIEGCLTSLSLREQLVV